MLAQARKVGESVALDALSDSHAEMCDDYKPTDYSPKCCQPINVVSGA